MLDDFGILRIRGPDAARFLQGQLSNDVEDLQPQQSQLAGLHNPHGRTIAVLRLFALAADDFLALLPGELAHPVLARLSRYVLRAKLTLAEESQLWRVAGVRTSEATLPVPAAGLAASVDATARRWLLVMPHSAADPVRMPAGVSVLSSEDWRLADIASGLPQVHVATSETFVAQMLNLDCVGAISFRKGCYTGQEVIARAHYRGRVKRRMQRFRVRTQATLVPGTAGRFADGRSFVVVDAVRTGDAEAELLAVAPYAGTSEPGEGTATDAAGPLTKLDAEQLPLPYALPE